MHLTECVKTSRREARETYCRYLMFRAGLDAADIDAFMEEPAERFEGRTPLEMIYTGEYTRAVAVIEELVDDFLETLATLDSEEGAA
jgi:hypothetical protein